MKRELGDLFISKHYDHTHELLMIVGRDDANCYTVMICGGTERNGLAVGPLGSDWDPEMPGGWVPFEVSDDDET